MLFMLFMYLLLGVVFIVYVVLLLFYCCCFRCWYPGSDLEPPLATPPERREERRDRPLRVLVEVLHMLLICCLDAGASLFVVYFMFYSFYLFYLFDLCLHMFYLLYDLFCLFVLLVLFVLFVPPCVFYLLFICCCKGRRPGKGHTCIYVLSAVCLLLFTCCSGC